ncbi:MAG: prepilin-type N-terminal cleavage/methylation domain-containing protein [Armatimonadetes bacterium]|nr:prepilin-type N-terminal cleavage/methylation domain-containing protein [Armatimonadota bacterium]
MPRRRTPGFTLIELVVVLLILAVLIAIAVPYFGRMRANNQINVAAERMESEVQQAQTEARGFGLRHERDGNPLAPPPGGVGNAPAGSTVVVRLVQSPENGPQRVLRIWEVAASESVPLSVQNLPNVPFDSDDDVGTMLEIGSETGGVFTALGGLPIQPDGSILVNAAPAVILIGRPDHQYRLQAFPSGKVLLEKS